jgi:hypothetical protein
MINRRLMIVPPALLSHGHSEPLESEQRYFFVCYLKRRT